MRAQTLWIVFCGLISVPTVAAAGDRGPSIARKFQSGWRHAVGRLLFWSVERRLLRIEDRDRRRPFAGPLRLFPVRLLIPKDLRKHSLKAARDSRAIADHLGLARPEAEAIGFAGLIHDIGKFAISREILDKPGPLDDGETTKMKKHATVGAHVARWLLGLRPDRPPSAFAEIVLDGVKHHHETWDGRGYPEGLAAEEIPLVARIVHVTDVVSARGEARSYHGPLPQAQVNQILFKGRRQSFDPHIVRTFFEVLRERLARIRSSAAR